VQDGQCVLTARAASGSPSTIAAEWAFGSGHRGWTYTGRQDGEPVELRLTYYSREKRWAFTPGQQMGVRTGTPVGRKMDLHTERGCFVCHSTALVEEAGRLEPGHSILGVGCETCHGAGREHVEAVQRQDPDLHMVRLGDYRDRVTIDLCGQCHRTATSNDPDAPMTRSQLPRLQGLAMSMSECFKKSGGKLSCVTCHDPHKNADRTSRVEYNRACLSCHSPQAADQVPCKVSNAAGDCVSCHMPEQVVDMPTSPKYRTHLIKAWGRKEDVAARLQAVVKAAGG
jgi:hypothetical protein